MAIPDFHLYFASIISQFKAHLKENNVNVKRISDTILMLNMYQEVSTYAYAQTGLDEFS